MNAWLIVASWWAQGALSAIQRRHLTTDPACKNFKAPRPGSWLDRASRGLECEPCMVDRALGDHTCRFISVDAADLDEASIRRATEQSIHTVRKEQGL